MTIIKICLLFKAHCPSLCSPIDVNNLHMFNEYYYNTAFITELEKSLGENVLQCVLFGMYYNMK